MEKLILRLASDTEQVQWAVLKEDGSLLKAPEYSTISEVQSYAKNREVIALAPSDDILITQVDLPQASHAKLKKAIP